MYLFKNPSNFKEFLFSIYRHFWADFAKIEKLNYMQKQAEFTAVYQSDEVVRHLEAILRVEFPVTVEILFLFGRLSNIGFWGNIPFCFKLQNDDKQEFCRCRVGRLKLFTICIHRFQVNIWISRSTKAVQCHEFVSIECRQVDNIFKINFA